MTEVTKIMKVRLHMVEQGKKSRGNMRTRNTWHVKLKTRRQNMSYSVMNTKGSPNITITLTEECFDNWNWLKEAAQVYKMRETRKSISSKWNKRRT